MDEEINVLYLGRDTNKFDKGGVLEKQYGLNTTTTTKPENIKNILRKGSFDCVIIEQDFDSQETVESIRNVSSDIQIILESDQATQKAIKKTVASKADGYVNSISNEQDYEKLGNMVRRAVTEKEDEKTDDKFLDTVPPSTEHSTKGSIVLLNNDWEVIYLSNQTEEMLVMDKGELIGENIWKELPQEFRTTFFDKFDQAMVTQTKAEFEEYYDPLDKWFEVHAVPSDSTLSVYLREITEEKRRERELELVSRIAEHLSSADDLNSALKVVLKDVCKTTGWDYGEVWIPTKDRGRLKASEIWYSTSEIEGIEKFREITENLRIPKKRGLPGRVNQAKEIEWTSDITLQPHVVFVRGDIAKEVGFESQVAVPVAIDNEVVVVLSFFMLKHREEDRKFVSLMRTVADEIGLLLQKKEIIQRTPWLSLDEKYDSIDLLDMLGDKITQKILIECSQSPMTIEEIEKDITPNTVKKRIDSLLDIGLIKKVGESQSDNPIYGTTMEKLVMTLDEGKVEIVVSVDDYGVNIRLPPK